MSPTGALIMSTFAAIWWIVGVRTAIPDPRVVFVVPVLVSMGMAWALWRSRVSTSQVPDAEHARRDRIIFIASAAEGLAIPVAATVLQNLGWHDFTVSAIAVIVGLHFIPIARGLPAPRYYLTGGVLVAIGLSGVVIPEVNPRMLVVSIGAALTLWVTAASVLYRRVDPPMVPAID
jgi:hypothetical protein